MKNNDMYCDKCGAKTVNGFCPYCQAEELRKAPKNKGPIIGTVIIGVIILAAILFVTIGYFPNNKEANKETKPVNNSSSQTQTTSKKNEEYLVNAFSDSGIYVRSGPGANYPDVLYIKKNDTSVRLLKTGETTGDDGYTWYTVDIPGGDSGYVREDVVISESEIDQKKQDNSAASDSQTGSAKYNWMKEINSDNYGYSCEWGSSDGEFYSFDGPFDGGSEVSVTVYAPDGVAYDGSVVDYNGGYAVLYQYSKMGESARVYLTFSEYPYEYMYSAFVTNDYEGSGTFYRNLLP